MLKGVRRAMAHRREAREKAKMTEIERARRLSHIRVGRLEERRAAEEELREQVGTELSTHEATLHAYRERRQMEKELRGARGGISGTGVARSAARTTKKVLWDYPIKSVRVVSRMGKGASLNKILLGNPQLILGPPTKRGTKQQPTKGMHESIFGSPPTKKTGKGLDIFEVDKDVLK